jgi:hypothetical protein
MTAGNDMYIIAVISSLRGKLRSRMSRPTDRRHHRPAEALHDAHRHQHAEAVGHAAQHRAGGEDEQRGDEDAAGAEAVGEPAAHRDEGGDGEHIGGHRHVQPHRRGAEAARHVGDGGGDDRRIQLFHQERHGDDDRDEDAQTGIAFGREARLVWGTLRRMHEARSMTAEPLPQVFLMRILESYQ